MEPKKIKKRKMKGIVLSGGSATRLYPLTATTSKQLLPVYDRQMIFYPINTLVKAGVRDILIIVDPEYSGQYLNLLGSIFRRYKINIFFQVQKVPKGLAEAFVLGESFIGHDNVTMILGDNIFEDDFSEQIKNFTSGAQVFAKKVEDPERFGVVKFNDKKQAVKIVEKPKEWLSDYALVGLYVYDNRVIDFAKETKYSERGELEIVSLHNRYLKLNELKVTTIDGAWLDAGTFDSLLEAGKVVKDREIYKNFSPIVNKAIKEFSDELRIIAKKKLA